MDSPEAAMAMQIAGRKDDDLNSEINTTPLIDVMLVLLIMLIVTLPAPLHGIKIDRPVPCPGCATTEVPLAPIRIAIDFDGAVTWNGVSLDAASLDRRLFAEAHRPVQPEIHIVPHRLAKYGYVAHVMASVQRRGLTKLGVVYEG
jgi:biopolymer transport protein ExbD